MPQIAQQDYIRIPVADLDSGKITAEEKKAILKHIANWPDILIEDSNGNEARILARNKTSIFYYSGPKAAIVQIELNA